MGGYAPNRKRPHGRDALVGGDPAAGAGPEANALPERAQAVSAAVRPSQAAVHWWGAGGANGFAAGGLARSPQARPQMSRHAENGYCAPAASGMV